MTTNVIVAPEAYPFRVLVGPAPLLSAGDDVRVSVSLVHECDPERRGEIDGFVDAFWMLASSGGLSGDSIPPHDSEIAEKGDLIVQRTLLSWDLIGCRIDERAVLNLLNLFRFEHRYQRFASVEVSHAAAPQAGPLAVSRRLDDYYPKMYEPPFRLTIDRPIGDSVSLRLQLADIPTDSNVEAIEQELLSWSVAPSVGAFAVPGVDIHATGMEPEQTIEVIDTEILWSIHRFRTHPAAIDSLVNCCIAVSHRVAPIAAITIS